MKTLLTLATGFTLSALLLTAQAQTPATTHDNPTPAKASYQGPMVTKDSKALGQKMVQKSKPTDMRMRVPVRPKK